MSSTNRKSIRHCPGQMYRAITSSSDTSFKYSIPAKRALIFDKGDILVCKSLPRDSGPSSTGLINGYIKGTRHLGFAGEGLFHPDQVEMIEDSKSSSDGAGAVDNRNDSRSTAVAINARRKASGGSAAPPPSRVGARQQLYVAKTSSVESWSKYKIQDPRLEFEIGDHLVSERVSRTTGEHFGYVVDTNYPVKEKRPCPSKSKGYFHPEQVQIVGSSPSSICESTMRSSPGEKHNDGPAVIGGGASGGGACAPDKDFLLSCELSTKRRKIGRESANIAKQPDCSNIQATLSQSLSAKRDAGIKKGGDASSTKACTSRGLSASKRPSDLESSSGPLHEEDTETKLSRGLSAKRVKRSDSAASFTSESNNPGISAKMLGGRFHPPKRGQPTPNAAKRKVESMKPDQAQRATVARKDSSRSIASTNNTNAKISTNDEIEITKAKENRAALSAESAESSTSAAALSEGNNALDVHDLVALQSKPPKSKGPSSLEYVQVPTALAMKSRFPPGCVVIHTSDDGSTHAYTISSVHLKLNSNQLISGRSSFGVLFKVGTGKDDNILPEESLVYARDCPILVKSDAVPHVESKSGWVPATVKSSMKLPGALEEDYVVIIANGGTAHVPRDAIRYRDHALSEKTDVTMSTEDTALPPSPATESVAEVTEDASKDSSSSLQRAPKKVANASDLSATIVCRIDVPDRVLFGTVQKLLSPKMELMKKRLKVDMFIVGSDLPPPRDAGIVRSFGDIFPRPLPNGVYSTSILIIGQAECTEKTRKATIFFLREGLTDDESLDKDLEAGCSKARAITRSNEESANATKEIDTTASSNASSIIKLEALSPLRSYRLPIWISYEDVSDFLEGSQVKSFERQSGVKIQVSDRRSPVNVALSCSGPQDLWAEWESLTGAISMTIDEDMRPRFLYDVIMYNYGGKLERKKSPVLRCQSPFDRDEKLLMAVLPIPTRPKGSYAGYIVGRKGKQKSLIEEIGCTFDVYEFPSRQDLSYVLVTGTVRDDVKAARDIIQDKIDECRDLRKIEIGVVEDEEEEEDDEHEGSDEEAQVTYQPPSHDLGDEDEDEDEVDEPEVVFRPQRLQEGTSKRTIQILNVGIFIGNDWAQVKRWQNKFKKRGVKLSVRVRESKADVSGPEHELDSVVREINSWQRSQRPSTPPRRQQRRTSDVVFGGVVM